MARIHCASHKRYSVKCEACRSAQANQLIESAVEIPTTPVVTESPVVVKPVKTLSPAELGFSPCRRDISCAVCRPGK